jgi:DNA-binding CsgD family transcriptional regulator
MTFHAHTDGGCGDCLVFGAIEGLSDGLVLVDEQEKVFLVNRAAETFLGRPGQKLMGRPLSLSLAQPELAAFWKEARALDQPVTADLATPGGIQWRATVSPCSSVSGVRFGRALLLRDVTSEKMIRLQLTESVARRLVEMSGLAPDAEGAPVLTRRELEVLRLLGEGMNNAQIAERLSLSRNTVASHLKRLYAKISVAGRAQAAIYAHERGLTRSRR